MYMNYVNRTAFKAPLFLLNSGLAELASAMDCVIEDYTDAEYSLEKQRLEAVAACYLTYISLWLTSGIVYVKDGKVLSLATPSELNLRELYYCLRRAGFSQELCVFVLDLNVGDDSYQIPNALGVELLRHICMRNAVLICYLVHALWHVKYCYYYEEGNRLPFSRKALLDAEQRQFYRDGYLLSNREQCEMVKHDWFSSAFLMMSDAPMAAENAKLCVSLRNANTSVEIVRLSTALAVNLNTTIPFIYQAYQQALAA